MKKKKTKRPTAADRTPSLFTGKTDIEDRNARDGSPSESPRYYEAPRRRRDKGFKYKPGPVSQSDRNR